MSIGRRQLQPTPVLLPGKSHGWRSLEGCSPGGCWRSGMTERLHFHALEKEMATHSSVLAWRIPGTEEPVGLLSMGSHRVGHYWRDLAVAVSIWVVCKCVCVFVRVGGGIPIRIVHILGQKVHGSSKSRQSPSPLLCFFLVPSITGILLLILGNNTYNHHF